MEVGSLFRRSAAFLFVDRAEWSRREKAAEEKKEALLEHFSRDPDVEKARTEIEHAQEIEETFDKDFYGVGLS